MATNLPVNIETTYPNAGSVVRALHQTHHDRLHEMYNQIMGTDAVSSEVVAKLGFALGVTSAGDLTTVLSKAANLSDLANAATARTNLGLGSAATTATTAYDSHGSSAAAQAAAIAASLQRASNLSDLANPATARTNLGLGTAATTASTAYQAAGESTRALAAEALLAPKASPTFTGIPITPALSITGLPGAVAGGRLVGYTASVAPTTGTFSLGDTVFTRTGSIYTCTTAGTPGAWTQISGVGSGLVPSNNLSDLTNVTTARTNLGLGTAATTAATAYEAAGESTRALAAEALLAPKASPTFTGVVTSPVVKASGLTGATSSGRWVGTTTSLAPTSGAFLVGDWVTSLDGHHWICVTAGTPGSWLEVGANPLVVANRQTGTTYTLALSDSGKTVEMNNASANTLTIPPNSSVALPVGSLIEIMQYGAGQTTIAAGVGVTLRYSPGLKLTAQYTSAGLRKIATDEWSVTGALTT